ncbi:MAG: Atxe2 family lasso peptide isopeptidase [Hyphomonadaceae bacterium]|nr:Atxe2 family lasso peptide isopeptidase [Hyphomonadaceae bacterium]
MIMSTPRLCALATLIAGALFLTGSAGAHASSDARPSDVALLLDALAGMRDLDGLSLSPDGQHFVVLERRPIVPDNRVVQTWLIADIADGRVRPLADGGAMMFKSQPSVPPLVSGFPDDARAFWSVDGLSVYFRRRAAENGVIRLWRSRLRDRRLSAVTSKTRDVVAVESAMMRPGLVVEYAPHAIADVGREREAGERRGFLLDSRFSAISASFPQIPALDGTPSFELYDTNSNALHRLSADEGVALMTTELPPARAVVLAPGGDARAWALPENPDRPGLSAPYRVHVRDQQGTASACPAEACLGRITDIWWINASELAFLRLDGVNATRTQIWRWRVNEPQAALVLDSETRLRQCGLADSKLYCLAESAIEPVTVTRIDLDTGATELVYDPNPDFPRARLAPAQRLYWRAPNGVETHGDLVLPLSHRPGDRHPLVITTYLSRGFLKGGTGDEYPIQAFAAAGFAVLNIHTPAHPTATQVTRDPIEASRISRRGMADRRNALGAVITGVETAEALGVIDGAHIAMTGFSYGSEMTHHAVLCWDRLGAAIVSGPSYDPLTYYMAGESTQAAFTRMGFGNPLGPDREMVEMLSFGLHAADAGAPLLINSADREYMAALFGYTQLREAQRPVEMHVFPDAYHFKWRPAQRRAIYERNLDWLRFWLMDEEDPAPEKQAQYQRWRQLRPLAEAASRAPRGAADRCLP